MDPQEIDSALDELETRLDRLRALYEQYFLGIEKIEPSIARKDVDRRFWILKRTKIRNTARRFRMQTLIQRYNTFQQYWGRICREIENGTYVRHLIKAQKTQGAEPKTWAAKKRLGMFRKDRPGEAAPDGAAPDGAAGDSAHPPDLGGLLDSGMDLAAEAASAAAEALANAERAKAAATERAARAARALEDLGPLDLDFDDAPLSTPERRPAVPTAPLSSKPSLPSRSMTAPVSAVMPTPSPQAPSSVPTPSARPSLPTAGAPSSMMPTPSARPSLPTRPAGAPSSTMLTPSARAPSSMMPTPSARPSLPTPSASAGAPSMVPTPSARPSLPVPSTRAPTVTHAPPSMPVPSARAPSGAAPAGPAPSMPAPSRPAAGESWGRLQGPGAPRPAPSPVAPAASIPAPPSAGRGAVAPTRPAPAARAAAPAPAPAAQGGAGLSDARLQQLHAELVATRRKLNQADNVSIDSLAKSLRETESKLRAQHKGSSVDFQVVVKDGKPVVKPVVRR